MPGSPAPSSPDGGDGEVVVVFTSKTTAMLLAERGSAAWPIDARRTRNVRYLICTRRPGRGSADGRRGQAFLAAEVSGIVAVGPPRCRPLYRICIRSYAPIAIDDFWPRGAGSPRYFGTEAVKSFGLDLSLLHFTSLGDGAR